MLAWLFVASLALAQETEEGRDEEGGYLMNDVGAWVYLPSNLDSGIEWSDWDFKAKSGDGGVELKLWLTEFQHDVTMDVLQDFGEDYMERAEKLGGAEPKVTKAELTNWGDKEGGRVDVEFAFQEGRVRGYAYHAIIPSAGQMIHIRTIAAGRNARKAESVLAEVATKLKRDKAPLPTTTDKVTSEAGFAATLPKGWRAPVEPEYEEIQNKAELVGQKDLSGEQCWTAIEPPTTGEVDLIFACKHHAFLGPLDEHSWEGEEATVRQRFFGASEIPDPDKVQVGDRLGFYYKPKDGKGALRLAVAPYEGGLMAIWGMAGDMEAAELDAAMQSILPTVEYTGPDGGQPVISADKWVGYYLKHRTFSPIVLGPALLLVGGIVGAVAISKRRAATKYDDI